MKPDKKIAIVSPSVMLSDRDFNEALWRPYFETMGIEVVVMPSAYQGRALETFQAKNKAEDIMKAYEDKRIDALVALHGGASALRTLEYLDYGVIQKHNKPIIGFSDTTSLQLAVFAKTGNPYVTGFLPEYDFRGGRINPTVDKGLKAALSGQKFEAKSGVCVHEGTVEGVLIGGNMSTLSDLSGTPYYPDLTDKILLLEDECEVSYKLKLMLTQLKYNPTFKGVKGIVFGRFSQCKDHATHGSVESVVEDFAAQVNVPTIKSFNYGHFKKRFVLTCGVKYRLDAAKASLKQIDG